MNSVLRFESRSEEETLAIGRKLAQLLPKSATVLLSGDLGAGKTTLAKGIVEGRGAAGADDVSSPTFTLIHEYGDPVAVYHVDVYRLESQDQARRLGLEELQEQGALVLIEWGEKFPELLAREPVEIRLRHAGEGARVIEISGLGGSGGPAQTP